MNKFAQASGTYYLRTCYLKTLFRNPLVHSIPQSFLLKKHGTTRYCVDYRKLNEVTKKDSYPLPRIDDTLDALQGVQLFSTLDIRSGYWQIELHPSAKEKTAFITHKGLYERKFKKINGYFALKFGTPFTQILV